MQELCDENVYFVIEYLKSIGVGKIIVNPINDINNKNNKCLYEVETIKIIQNGKEITGNKLTKNSEVIILYHNKLEVLNRYSSRYFKNKKLNDVMKELKMLGFENIETNKISDVILGLFVKENNVESVVVCDEKIPIKKGKYKYDDKIIINYHGR
jgi:hypothetical protein